MLGEMWAEHKVDTQFIQPYVDLAAADKLRFDNEWAAYSSSDNENENPKKDHYVAPKNKKDPMKPKKAMTAYMAFCTENRAQVIEKNDGIKQPEIIKKLGEMWAELKQDTENIKEYIDMAALDKERYQREMEAYSAHQAVGGEPSKGNECPWWDDLKAR
tara:strand:- start:680 stop:1156 length:477 start_codon:yes stop_codon:yes gene_type:complete